MSATAAVAAARPTPSSRPRGVEGDISKVVGGATDKPIPPPPKKIEPKGARPAARTRAACWKPSAGAAEDQAERQGE